MTKKLIGINCYLFCSKDKTKIDNQKLIEQNKYHATITDRFVCNEYAFESQRPKYKF